MAAIGEVAGFIHSTGGDYRYQVLGYVLHPDGVWVVGRRIHEGTLTGDWASGFNRSPEEVIWARWELGLYLIDLKLFHRTGAHRSLLSQCGGGCP